MIKNWDIITNTSPINNWDKLGEPQVTKTRENCENRKIFVRCCYWRWWCWFILNSSHVRFLSTTYTYHRTLNSLRTQFNTQDLTKRSPKKFSNKIMFSVVESPIELFMSTHWRTCLRYKVGIKWQNFVYTFLTILWSLRQKLYLNELL